MAEFFSNYSKYYRLRLSVEQQSQNIEQSNTSIKVKLQLISGGGSFAQYNVSAYIDGLPGGRVNWNGRPTVNAYQTITLIERTVSIPHNDDGTKTFTLNGSFTGAGGYSPGNMIVTTGNYTLPKINRLSTGSAKDVELGQPQEIAIKSFNSNYRHTVRVQFKDKTQTIAENASGNVTWTPPYLWHFDIEGERDKAKISIDTYSGNTKLGTTTFETTLIVPKSVVSMSPVIKLSETNPNLDGISTNNTFVRIMSGIKVNFTVDSNSTMLPVKGYKAQVVETGQVITENGGVINNINVAGEVTIRAWVIDRRGRLSNPRDAKVTMLDYFPPQLSLSANRTRADNTILQVVRNAKIAPLKVDGAQKNKMTLSIKVQRVGTNDWVTEEGDAVGTWSSIDSFVNSAANLSRKYPANQSFKVVGTIRDLFGSSTFEAPIVPTESVVMYYDKDGRVGIGKPVELGGAGSLDVAGKIYSGGAPVGFYGYNSTTDLDNLFTSGIYYFDKGASGQPTGIDTWGYVENVVSNSPTYNQKNNWIWQYLRTTSGHSFTRHRINAESWSEWIENTPVKRIETGWVSTGVTGVKAKRTGDLVYVQIDNLALVKSTEKGLGTLPNNMLPPNEMMVTMGVWNVFNDVVKIQVNKTGGMAVLGSTIGSNVDLRGQFSFAI